MRRAIEPGPARGKSRKARSGATMATVAALAGVTKMTVSRVLREPEKVNETTRSRVLAAMRELDYVPNRLAGGLTAGSSGLVAAIVPTLRHALFADTLEGLGEVLAETGLGLFVSSTSYRVEVEEAQVRSILERRPDALVLTGRTHTAAVRELLSGFGLPVVETWETAGEPVDTAVGFSNREAAHAMTTELLRCGYRRIAFVNGPAETNERARRRAEGYLAAVAEAGLEAPPVLTVSDETVIEAETGARAVRALLRRDPAIDAIFFTSDVFAVGAILACRELGVEVPGRLGIAGFHDLAVGRIVSPTLTTVKVPALEIGRRAGHLILARLSGAAVAERVVDLGFSIIARESTRRAR